MSNNTYLFIGRRDAIDLFRRLSVQDQVNCLYIQATGGIGKTRLLHELIRICSGQGWQLRPADSQIDILIDFSALANRSIAGLRHSIIARLGEGGFSAFRESEAELQAESKFAADHPNKALDSKVFALRRRTNDLFFSGFKQAQRGRHTALFFDTFEIAYRRRVGHWFIDQLLEHSEECLVVFAGRPPASPSQESEETPWPVLPSKVHRYELKPWTDDEAIEYFTKRHWHDTPKAIQQLRVVTGGHPLLMDMAIYVRDSSLIGADKLLEVTETATGGHVSQEVEKSLIRRLLNMQSDEQAIIMEMAYLKRRFDAHIFRVRQQSEAYSSVVDFESLVNDLFYSKHSAREGLSSIVKYREDDKVLTLHDEVQRMIEEYAHEVNGLWRPTCEELYQQIIKGWYDSAIKQAETDELEHMLRAEQLGYELEHDLDTGIDLYEGYFAKAQKHLLFEFNELIWGEIADKIAQGHLAGQEYELCYGQADWLWSVGQFDAAADLLRLIVDKYTPERADALRRLDALASLGHADMHQGKYADARRAFDEGQRLAEEIHNDDWISAFQQNIGQLLQQTNQWDQASEQFKMAVSTAQASGYREALALALLYLGRLQALLGEYRYAILNCEKAVALRRDILADPTEEQDSRQEEQGLQLLSADIGVYYSEEGMRSRVGLAYLQLGEVYRYAGDLDNAQSNYERAQSFLVGLNRFGPESEVLQELGSILLDKSVRARREGNRKKALRFLTDAFDRQDQAITKCRQYDLRALLPKALHRLAHVVFTIGEFEAVGKQHVNQQLRDLLERVSVFLLPEEEYWLNSTKRLRESAPFAELSTTAKAQRMFEVSSLEAERQQDANTMLDSLVEACKIALHRRRPDDVRAYAQLSRMPTQAYQEKLFLALVDIIMADLDLSEGRFDAAFEGYSTNFPILAQHRGYGSYLLREYLARFLQRLQGLPQQEGRRLVDRLIQVWTERKLDEEYPELFFQMYEYRNRE